MRIHSVGQTEHSVGKGFTSKFMNMVVDGLLFSWGSRLGAAFLTVSHRAAYHVAGCFLCVKSEREGEPEPEPERQKRRGKVMRTR